jgi:hypothetical protein
MVVFLAVGAAVLLNAGSASAQLCVNVSGACNSYFFGVSATAAPDLFAINGFEYGCGQSRTRHASGVIRSVAGRLEIEFTGTNENFDFAQGVAWSGQVANPGLTGTYKVLYTEINGGVLQGHGATGAVTLAGCTEPALAQRAEEKDTSQQ